MISLDCKTEENRRKSKNCEVNVNAKDWLGSIGKSKNRGNIRQHMFLNKNFQYPSYTF